MSLFLFELFFLEEATRARQPRLSNLFQAKFSRIILDDAKKIMDPNLKISEDFCMLRGDQRWTITATQVPDSYLFSYFRFMQSAPLNDVAILLFQILNAFYPQI